MKFKTLKRVLLGACTLLITQTSFAQTDLLIGYRAGSGYSDSLSYADTTGGTFVITESNLLTTDYMGGVEIDGLFGMALNPFTNDMYCIYGIGESTTRRLGILNTENGEISDIGESGNISDITFIDNNLYCTTGTEDGYRFGTIDIATAEYTSLFTHLNPNWSNAISFDYYKGSILKSTQSGSKWDRIDAVTEIETTVDVPYTHPGWTTCLVVINDSTTLTGGSSTLRELNTNTYVHTSVFSAPGNVHSLAFSQLEPSLWVNGPRSGCVPNETELVFIGGGTTFEWYKDDVLVDGADTETLETTEGGEFYVIVDGNKSNNVTITFSGIEASFTSSANPAFLEGAASVEVVFSETLPAGPYTYSWDSGNGETSTDENPTFTYDAIGTYPVELTVTDTIAGCTNSTTEILEVAGGVGINELDIAFNLFPVPTTDVLYIQYQGATSYTLEVLDISGAVINKQIIAPNVQNVIDINNLESGTYFVNITNGTSTSKHKFIKQ